MENIIQYNELSKEKYFAANFIDVFTIIYCGFCILELGIASYRYICLALLSLWWTLAFFFDKNAAMKTFANKIVQILFLYTALLFFYISFTNDVVLGAKRALALIINESPFLIFIYYKNRCNRYNSPRILTWGGLCVIFILCINILRLLSVDPNAARTMAGSHNIYENYVAGGGYELAYTLALLTPFLIFSFKTYKHKFIVLILIVVFSYTLIKCSYTIATLLAILEFVLLIYWKERKKYKYVHFMLISTPFFFVIVFLLRDVIANIIIVHVAPLFSGLFIEHRIRQIGELLSGHADEYNGAIVRFNLYWESFKTFLNSPLIGISYLTKFNAVLETNYIGQHSTVCDGLARVGAIFFLYLIYFKKVVVYLKRKTECDYVIIVGIIFFFIKLINAGNVFGLSYAAFLCVPMLSEQLTRRSKIY